MSCTALESRLQSWRLKQAAVQRALDEEMRRHYSVRQPSLLTFLYRENIVCSEIVGELESLAAELKDSGV